MGTAGDHVGQLETQECRQAVLGAAEAEPCEQVIYFEQQMTSSAAKRSERQRRVATFVASDDHSPHLGGCARPPFRK